VLPGGTEQGFQGLPSFLPGDLVFRVCSQGSIQGFYWRLGLGKTEPGTDGHQGAQGSIKLILGVCW